MDTELINLLDTYVRISQKVAHIYAGNTCRYSERGLTEEQCLRNLIGSFNRISNSINLPLRVKTSGAESIELVLGNWICTPKREAGLTLEQCLVNLFGSSLIIVLGFPGYFVPGPPDLIALVEGTLQATGLITSAWVLSARGEPYLTVEQCRRNLLGSMLSEIQASAATYDVKLQAILGTGLNIADWVGKSYQIEPTTIEVKTVNYLRASLSKENLDLPNASVLAL